MNSSRLNRIADKKSGRQAVVYLVLSVLFVILMIKWGVPGFIQLLAWWSGADKPSQVGSTLKVKPQAPALEPMDEATFSASIRVAGVAQSGVKVRLITNSRVKDEQTSDSNGKFIFESVPLLDGKNVIGVQSITENGLESDITQADVVLDQEEPTLEITEPANESDFYGQTQRNVTIKGKTSEKGEVYISGNFVVVSVGGEFSYRLPLNPGMNEIEVTATDLAGNKTTSLLRLRYSQ